MLEPMLGGYINFNMSNKQELNTKFQKIYQPGNGIQAFKKFDY